MDSSKSAFASVLREKDFPSVIQIELAFADLGLLPEVGQAVDGLHRSKALDQRAVLGEIGVEVLDVGLERGLVKYLPLHKRR